MSIRNRHAIRKQMQKKSRTVRPWPALVGDGNGTIEVPGKPGYWYVRPVGSDLPVIVYRGGAPKQENYPVWVGQDVYNRRWIRILGTNLAAIGGSITPTEVGPHGETHFVRASDPAPISPYQIAELNLSVVSGLTVRINGGLVIVGGQPAYVNTQTVDLTSHVPATYARWAIIRANNEGTLSVQDGPEVPNYADLSWANMPALASDYAALWVVRLYAGQTAVSNSWASIDYFPLWQAPSDKPTAGSEHNVIRYSSGIPVYYAADDAGLASALADAVAGDEFLLPPIEFTGDFSCAVAVTITGQSRNACRIVGSFTGADGTVLEDMAFELVQTSGTKTALTINGDGTLFECAFYISDSGSGVAYAVTAAAEGGIGLRNTFMAWEGGTGGYLLNAEHASSWIKWRHGYAAGTRLVKPDTAARVTAYSVEVDDEDYITQFGIFGIGDRAVWNHTHEAGGSLITAREIDADPSANVNTLIFPNGTLTDNLDGSVSINYPIGAEQTIVGAVLLLDETVDSEGQADFEIDSIAADYAYIEFFIQGKSEYASATTDPIVITLNDDDTNANYRVAYASWGNTSAAGQEDTRKIGSFASSENANMSGALRGIIHNPGATTIYKTIITHFYRRETATNNAVGTRGIQWESAAAITKINLALDSAGEFAEGTRCVIVGHKEVVVGGDMLKSVYDTDDDGVVDNSAALNSHADTYFATAAHDHDSAYLLLDGSNDPLTGDVYGTDFVKTRAAAITRDEDGRIETVAKTGGRTITITRDVDGLIESFSDTVYTWTLSRDEDNRIDGWSVA